MKILIVDPITNENYDFKYTESNPIGGIESSAISIARELAKNHDVYFAQLNRDTPYKEHNVTYISKADSLKDNKLQPDTVIVLRKHKVLTQYHKAYPDANKFVWVHNFQGYEVITKLNHIIRSRAKVICISKSLEKHINNIFNGPFSWAFRLLMLQFRKVPTCTIYYPIDPDFIAEDNNYDPNKLLFFSAPYKGLKQAMGNFRELIKVAPDFKLYVTAVEESIEAYNLDRDLIESGSVILLGRLSKEEIISHLKSSFCVFYAQNEFAETFGRVYIEANCTGTPILCHPLGSAVEVMDNKDQFVNAADTQAVIDKVLDWKKNGRPKVSCKKEFFMDEIVKKWQQVLNLDR